MLEKFLETVLDSRGKVSAKRFNKEYFAKAGSGEAWQWFESLSLEGYDNRSKLFLIRAGVYEAPKCIECGENAKVQFYVAGGEISDYCSDKCAKSSKVRVERMVKTKAEQTEEKKLQAKSKREETMLIRYGRKFNSFGLHKTGKPHNWKPLPEKAIAEKYAMGYSLVMIGEEYGVDYDTIRTRLTKNAITIRQSSHRSREEASVEAYIKSLGFEVESGNRMILGGRELDLVVHEQKIAIEIDGLFWHSSWDKESDTKLKRNHLFKTEACLAAGYRLIHITDEQWNAQQEVVKSMLCNALGKSPNKVYARKCTVREVSARDATQFFSANHIQGHTNAKHYYGLYSGEDLVSCMSFSRVRFEAKSGFELIRSATKKFHVVVGGFSKILKHFRANHKGSILSYCDRMYSTGEIYLTTGFKLLRTSSPGYFWCDKRKSYNRQKFQKHKLGSVLETYDPELSERDNMFANGYRRFWNCGQLTFVLD